MQESKCYSRPCEYCSDQDQYFSYSHRVLIVVVLWFPRQEYWSGLPFPSPGDSDPGIEPRVSCTGQGDYLPLSHLGSPQTHVLYTTLWILWWQDQYTSYTRSLLIQKKRQALIQVIAISEGFPGGTSGEEPTYQCRRYNRCRFDPWIRKIPWRRAQQSTSVFLPGESHGQRSLVGYGP